MFNEVETEESSKAEEPSIQTIVEAHKRKPKRTREEILETVRLWK